jgi:hypothetical protein
VAPNEDFRFVKSEGIEEDHHPIAFTVPDILVF